MGSGGRRDLGCRECWRRCCAARSCSGCPGLALTSWLLPRTSRLARVAVAPAVSFGLLFALGSYLDLVGVRVQWQTVALPVVVAAVAALVVRQWRRPWPAVRLTAAHAVLALSVVVAFWLWWYAIRSPETVPTYDDGANAAIFAHRIGLLGTLRPDQIIATDLGDGAGGVAYYPLALHLVASFLVDLTGVGIAAALHVEVAALVAVCLPVGAFALTPAARAVGPGVPVGPAVAAAAAGVGRSGAAGPAVGSAAVGRAGAGVRCRAHAGGAAPGAGRTAARVRAGVVVGVAVAGLFAVHSSEVVSAVVLGVAMVAAWSGAAAARWRTALVGLVVGGAVRAAAARPRAALARRRAERAGGGHARAGRRAGHGGARRLAQPDQRDPAR